MAFLVERAGSKRSLLPALPFSHRPVIGNCQPFQRSIKTSAIPASLDAHTKNNRAGKQLANPVLIY
jgi:hypothetical protein